MMKGQDMAGMVFLTMLITSVAAHGEGPPILPDPTTGTTDLQLAHEPLHLSAIEMDASMHAKGHDTAEELAMGPPPHILRGDDASLPVTAKSPQTHGPRSDSPTSEQIAEGYGADAHAHVPSVAPSIHTPPPSVTVYTPWIVFNSSDPAYMRRPHLIKFRGDDGNVTRRPSICNPGTFRDEPQSVFNRPPANALGRWYFKVNGSDFWCSATLIQPTVILTALHCVYDCKSRVWGSNGTFYHQYYNGGFNNSANGRHYVGWTDSCTGSFGRIDFAVVRLDRAITLPFYPTVTRSTTLTTANSQLEGFIYSYPATWNGRVPVYSTKEVLLPIRYPTASQLETDLSIEAGSSGSALYVLVKSPLSSRATPTIAAVTSYEYLSKRCPNGFAAFQSNGYNVQTLLTYLPT